MSQMTATEYQAHLDFIAKRDEIINAEKDKQPTHLTARPVWHGYDRPANHPVIFSQALTDLFAEALPETWGKIRDKVEPSGWFIEPNGDILHLWLNEAFVIELAELTDGQILDTVWEMLTNQSATTEQVIAYLKGAGF